MLIPIFIHEPDHRNRSNSFTLQFVCRMRSACLPSALRLDAAYGPANGIGIWLGSGISFTVPR